jgi:cytochrome P450
VIAEAMRLYPPAWAIGRRALRDYQWGGFAIPADSVILMSQWIMHRDPRYWPEPERFDPSRWQGDADGRPRFAYFPFGAGNRICVGESFAWTEAILVLVTIAQRWRFVLDPEHPVVPQALITLRPRYGVRAFPELRIVSPRSERAGHVV